jgi:hypothetical protein
VLAAGEIRNRVHLFDLLSHKRLRMIDTTLDFGGQRLAVSTDGELVIVGAYNQYGVAAYSGVHGTEVWRRQDLKKVQNLRFGDTDLKVLCGFERGHGEVLDASNGQSGQPMLTRV